MSVKRSRNSLHATVTRKRPMKFVVPRVLLDLPIGFRNGSEKRPIGFPNRYSNRTRRRPKAVPEYCWIFRLVSGMGLEKRHIGFPNRSSNRTRRRPDYKHCELLRVKMWWIFRCNMSVDFPRPTCFKYVISNFTTFFTIQNLSPGLHSWSILASKITPVMSNKLLELVRLKHRERQTWPQCGLTHDFF